MKRINELVFSVIGFRLEFDRDYGVDHKSGWSVRVEGKSYVVALEPWLWRAIYLAWRRTRRGVI